MQDLVLVLKRIMRVHGLNRADVAAKVRVSEATISRILRGKTTGYGRARKRVLEFTKSIDEESSFGHEAGAGKIVKAFNKIWDGSDDRARAVAKIIVALGELCPPKASERGQVERQRKPAKAAIKKRRAD